MDAYAATRDASVCARFGLRASLIYYGLIPDPGPKTFFFPHSAVPLPNSKRVCSVEYVVNKKRARWISIFVESYGKTFARDPNSAECLAVSGLAILVNGICPIRYGLRI